ncbi:hypothetical protein ACQ33O_03200 [Ferruginibacter sp. SUN002]|uniref:hypothetical protein n=1 Tax=Ferruginibacter sp. SUN002 TaxID=2937789 RepID=UPI003D360738
MFQTIAPYFGYIASLLLVVALLVNHDLKSRWFNALGNIAFITYAIVFSAIPVLITNCILLAINLYYLILVYSKKERFDLLEFNGDEKLILKFLAFYKKDIETYFPGVNQLQIKDKLNFVVIRDLVIANIFSATLHDNGDAEVIINYTLLKYRDYKIGRFIFEKGKPFLIGKGVKRIIYTNVHNKKHLQFITVMGFEKQLINNKECYVKDLVTD